MANTHMGANTKGRTGSESWRTLQPSLGAGTQPLGVFLFLGTRRCHAVRPHFLRVAAVRGQPPTEPNPRTGKKTGIPGCAASFAVPGKQHWVSSSRGLSATAFRKASPRSRFLVLRLSVLGLLAFIVLVLLLRAFWYHGSALLM